MNPIDNCSFKSIIPSYSIIRIKLDMFIYYKIKDLLVYEFQHKNVKIIIISHSI